MERYAYARASLRSAAVAMVTASARVMATAMAVRWYRVKESMEAGVPRVYEALDALDAC